MWLLMTYMVLNTLPVISSAMCPCQHHRYAVEKERSVGCCCCCHPQEETSKLLHDAHFDSLCTCGQNHATNQELYTIHTGEETRLFLRVVMFLLPVALSENSQHLHLCRFLGRESDYWVVAKCREGYAQSCLLRAPPCWV